MNFLNRTITISSIYSPEYALDDKQVQTDGEGKFTITKNIREDNMSFNVMVNKIGSNLVLIYTKKPGGMKLDYGNEKLFPPFVIRRAGDMLAAVDKKTVDEIVDWQVKSGELMKQIYSKAFSDDYAEAMLESKNNPYYKNNGGEKSWGDTLAKVYNINQD